MKFVKAEDDFYVADNIVKFGLDDEDLLSAEEEGFMHGYLAA